MSEASIYIVGGGSPMISTISISIGNHCNLQNLLHLAYPRSKHRSNILNSCWSCNKTNRYGIYIYVYIYVDPACKLPLCPTHETSNRSKVPLDHSGFFSSYKPNLHPLAMRQETNLKTVFNPTFKCLSVYINMHVGIIYISIYYIHPIQVAKAPLANFQRCHMRQWWCNSLTAINRWSYQMYLVYTSYVYIYIYLYIYIYT